MFQVTEIAEYLSRKKKKVRQREGFGIHKCCVQSEVDGASSVVGLGDALVSRRINNFEK